MAGKPLEPRSPAVGDPVVIRHEKYRIRAIHGNRVLARHSFGGREASAPVAKLRWDDRVGVWRVA